MRRLSAIVVATLVLSASLAIAGTIDRQALYQSQAIVTGQGEKNRQPGFRDCLDRVLVRVSGDQRLPFLPKMDSLRARAGSFVQSFSYHDRLAGRPIHDEQGTHDRPHDLTCRYDPAVLDKLLADLGSRPWLAERPALTVLMDVQRNAKSYDVTSDQDRDLAMRQSFDLAAAPMDFHVGFPSEAEIATLLQSSGKTRLGDLDSVHIPAPLGTPVIGRIVWSDKDLGWVATWHFHHAGRTTKWEVRGVNFDEAFRVAIRGAAQILSGNGDPPKSAEGTQKW